jgi:hypothetical protein
MKTQPSLLLLAVAAMAPTISLEDQATNAPLQGFLQIRVNP